MEKKGEELNEKNVKTNKRERKWRKRSKCEAQTREAGGASAEEEERRRRLKYETGQRQGKIK